MATIEKHKALEEKVQTEQLIEMEEADFQRRILSQEEGERLRQRLSEPARKPSSAMLQAIETYKRFMSQRSRE